MSNTFVAVFIRLC